jgi:hypothetical protein
MARITLGKTVVDTSQIVSMEVKRVGYEKYLLLGMGMGASALLVWLNGRQFGLTPGMVTIAVALLGALTFASLIPGVFADRIVDIRYSGGRGVQIECFSATHAREVRALIAERMAADKDRAG